MEYDGTEYNAKAFEVEHKHNRLTFDLKTERTPCADMADEMAHACAVELVNTLKTCVGKRVSELTEAQKYAIAVIAGCPADIGGMTHGDNSMRFATVPCAVCDADGGFMVAWCNNYGRPVYNELRLPLGDSGVTMRKVELT